MSDPAVVEIRPGLGFEVPIVDDQGRETDGFFHIWIVSIVIWEQHPYYVAFIECEDNEDLDGRYMICTLGPDQDLILLEESDPRIEPINGLFEQQRAQEAEGILARLADAKDVDILAQDRGPAVLSCDGIAIGYVELYFKVFNVEMSDYAVFSLVDQFGDLLCEEQFGFVIDFWSNGALNFYGKVVDDPELLKLIVGVIAAHQAVSNSN